MRALVQNQSCIGKEYTHTRCATPTRRRARHELLATLPHLLHQQPNDRPPSRPPSRPRPRRRLHARPPFSARTHAQRGDNDKFKPRQKVGTCRFFSLRACFSAAWRFSIDFRAARFRPVLAYQCLTIFFLTCSCACNK